MGQNLKIKFDKLCLLYVKNVYTCTFNKTYKKDNLNCCLFLFHELKSPVKTHVTGQTYIFEVKYLAKYSALCVTVAKTMINGILNSCTIKKIKTNTKQNL